MSWNNQKVHRHLNPDISVIALNVNGLNVHKEDRLSKWNLKKKKTQPFPAHRETNISIQKN